MFFWKRLFPHSYSAATGVLVLLALVAARIEIYVQSHAVLFKNINSFSRKSPFKSTRRGPFFVEHGKKDEHEDSEIEKDMNDNQQFSKGPNSSLDHASDYYSKKSVSRARTKSEKTPKRSPVVPEEEDVFFGKKKDEEDVFFGKKKEEEVFDAQIVTKKPEDEEEEQHKPEEERILVVLYSTATPSLNILKKFVKVRDDLKEIEKAMCTSHNDNTDDTINRNNNTDEEVASSSLRLKKIESRVRFDRSRGCLRFDVVVARDVTPVTGDCIAPMIGGEPEGLPPVNNNSKIFDCVSVKNAPDFLTRYSSRPISRPIRGPPKTRNKPITKIVSKTETRTAMYSHWHDLRKKFKNFAINTSSQSSSSKNNIEDTKEQLKKSSQDNHNNNGIFPFGSSWGDWGLEDWNLNGNFNLETFPVSAGRIMRRFPITEYFLRRMPMKISAKFSNLNKARWLCFSEEKVALLENDNDQVENNLFREVQEHNKHSDIFHYKNSSSTSPEHLKPASSSDVNKNINENINTKRRFLKEEIGGGQQYLPYRFELRMRRDLEKNATFPLYAQTDPDFPRPPRTPKNSSINLVQKYNFEAMKEYEAKLKKEIRCQDYWNLINNVPGEMKLENNASTNNAQEDTRRSPPAETTAGKGLNARGDMWVLFRLGAHLAWEHYNEHKKRTSVTTTSTTRGRGLRSQFNSKGRRKDDDSSKYYYSAMWTVEDDANVYRNGQFAVAAFLAEREWAWRFPEKESFNLKKKTKKGFLKKKKKKKIPELAGFEAFGGGATGFSCLSHWNWPRRTAKFYQIERKNQGKTEWRRESEFDTSKTIGYRKEKYKRRCW